MKTLFLLVLSILCVSCRSHEKSYQAAINSVSQIKHDPNDSRAWSELILNMDRLSGNAAYTEFVLIELSELTKKDSVNQRTIDQISNLTPEQRKTVQWMYDTSFYSGP
jgi:uncharacterized protein YcfL